MRDYETSHPWITFNAADLNDLLPQTWMLLGEAQAICEHMARTPLIPDVAEEMYTVALIKGAQATTAIEGNTLTEEQVAGIFRGDYTAPPSRAYQEREVRNVLDALTTIHEQAMAGTLPPVTSELICEYNRRVLTDTEYDDETAPGSIRQHSVVVGNYRGAPSKDCAHLVHRLAEWLESDTFRNQDPDLGFALVVAQAVYAHLYISWIHPFGDGNGRTARLLEFMLLARSGQMPMLAAHLLSNHYNLTRDQYYRELETASRTQSAKGFLAYAIQGFLDGLRIQMASVLGQQFGIAWADFVNETMNRFPTSPANDRQRSLVLAMPPDTPIPKDELPELTPELARLYATTGARTLSRDVNKLAKTGLIVRDQGGWRANHSIMRSFLPPAPTPGG